MENDHRNTGTFELTSNHPDIYTKSVEMQSELFKRGISWHNTFADECCEDFSCCAHKHLATHKIEFKGTLGPWTIENNIEGFKCIWGADESRICTIRHGKIELQQANAHFIAAAPELLEALILTDYENNDSIGRKAKDKIKSIINKALAL